MAILQLRPSNASQSLGLTDFGGKAHRSHIGEQTEDGTRTQRLHYKPVSGGLIAEDGRLSDRFIEETLASLGIVRNQLSRLKTPYHCILGTPALMWVRSN